jgi:Protein of unknown function (DUF2795)
MEQRSDKHGPRQDEALKHETEGLVHAGRTTRAEEWRDPEPPGEDQPDVDRAPNGTLTGAVPDGMTPEDVQRRSELAAYLGKEAYPTDRDDLLARMEAANAPDRLLDAVRALPGRKFDSLIELTDALGIGHEKHRF